MNERCIALLGRRDEPTDAVEEYCLYLKGALVPHGFALEVVRVPWAEVGWGAALNELRRRAAEWHGAWVFVQYTALAWSRRGFPARVLRILGVLKKSGARCAIVFHDSGPYEGHRIVDRVRRRVQRYAMGKAFRRADLVVLTVPAEKIGWLPARRKHAVFIPVGANLPSSEQVWADAEARPAGPPTVAVFSLSAGQVGLDEVACTVEAVRYAAERMGQLRLVALGRNSDKMEKVLREGLKNVPVEVTVYGLLSADNVVRVLGSSDVMLFPRGPLTTRRGSAIAGIACGLPVIGSAGWETAPPLTDAGVVLLPAEAKSEFGPALLKVLIDPAYRASLAARSRRAQEQHFSWEALAEKYAKAMRAGGNRGE